MGALAQKQCSQCGGAFHPRTGHQRWCSAKCRYAARDHSSATAIRARRERFRAYYGDRAPQPWLWGQPAYGSSIPGAELSVSLSGPAITHRGVYALHGMVTTVRGGAHHPNVADFALYPSHAGSGWSVYLRHAEDVERLAATEHTVRVGTRTRSLVFGMPRTLRAPEVRNRGRRRLRVDAFTPVCSRSMGGKVRYTAPTADTLKSTLTSTLVARLAVELRPDALRLRLASRSTTPHPVQIGKLGVVKGWVGSVELETNAVGEWLLRCAESIGLGGRTAFGFGRIAVSAASNDEAS